jgi:hypothetical protein
MIGERLTAFYRGCVKTCTSEERADLADRIRIGAAAV